MGPSVPVKFLITFAASLGLALTPSLALAQRGGGGGHSGGGGGGFHGGSSGGFHGSGGGSYGGGAESRGGGAYGGRSYGERSYGGGSYGRSGASAAGRSSGASAMRSSAGSRSSSLSSSSARSSNIRPAINDGQWHSFGNAASSGRSANSTLVARNVEPSAAGFRSFGSTSGAHSRRIQFRGRRPRRLWLARRRLGRRLPWRLLLGRLRHRFWVGLGMGWLGLRLRMALLGALLGLCLEPVVCAVRI